MISFFATLIAFSTLGLIVFQAIYALDYVKLLTERDDRQQISESRVNSASADQEAEQDAGQDEVAAYSPPAAIILCLKGADESLVDCLTGIIGQDYPDFQLNIVIDTPTDPAAEVVEGFFSSLKRKPKIHFLESPQETCSLKCSAISQVVDALPDRIEVVALIDCDAIVDQDWLSDLVTPLEDAGIGATTGNRWYSPTDMRLGGLVRKVWNAAAVVQMQRYDIAWGGSLAMRRDVIQRCQLLSKWRQSFCEDTSLTDELRKQSLRLERVANVIVDNKETSSFGDTFHWISRQLLTVRLHHPAWPMVLLHGIVTGIASILMPLLMVALFCLGSTGSAWALLQTIVVYQAANFALLFLIGRSNRAVIDSRISHDAAELVPEKNLMMYFLATLVTQIVQPCALWQAHSISKVRWRGATYQVNSGRTVKLLKVDDRQESPRGPVTRRPLKAINQR